MAAASHDNGVAPMTATAAAGTELPAVVPQWKRELILRRRAIARTLPAGSSSSLSVQFTCPPVVAAVRHPSAADASSPLLPQPPPLPPPPPSQSPADQSGERSVSPRCGLPSNGTDRPHHHQQQHQQPADFPFSAGGGGAMRLQPEPDRRAVNGGVDPVKYRALMGEEKTRPRCVRTMAGGVGLVLAEHNGHAAPRGEGDGLSDSSEELAYGPGIVKKLKSKYMSMTLREGKQRGVRPSLAHMRRAASLENLVDSEPAQETGSGGLPPAAPAPLIKPARFAKRQEAVANGNGKPARFRSGSRGNESIKRARSVEALLRYDAPGAIVKSLSRDEIVIVDKPVVARTGQKPVSEEAKPAPVAGVARGNKKRAAMNGLPPADVVKTTLKLFESGATRGNLVKLNVNAAPASGKPMLSPKPSPEKMRRANPLAAAMAKKPAGVGEAVAMDAERRAQLLSPVTIEVHELPSRVLTLDLKSVSTPTTPAAANASPSSPRQPPPISPFQRTLSPVAKLPSPVTKPMSPVAKLPSPVAKPLSPVAKLPSPVAKPMSPVVRERTPSPVKRTVSPVKRGPSPLRAASVTDGNEDEETTDGCVVEKAVPALENIRKAGHSVEISFKTNEDAKSHLPGSKPPPKASTVGSPVIAKSPTVPRPAPSVPSAPSATASKAPSAPVPKAPSVAATSTVPKSPAVSSVSVAKSPAVSSVSVAKSPAVSSVSVSKSPMVPSVPAGKSPTVPSVPAGKSPTVPSVPAGKSLAVPSVPISKSPAVASSSPGKSASVSFPEKRMPMSPLPELRSPDRPKQVGVIRPIVSKPLTEREVKKNLINSGKCEQPTKVVASLKASEIVSGNVSDALKDVKSLRDSVNANANANGTGLWDAGAGGKKPWHQHQNTVIFNFKDRKEVPDYVENDGIVMPYKREKIRPGESGFILLDPSLEESSTDCELDCADVLSGYAGPPSPCNVVFEGDNVLINGKSNLRKQPRQRKLRITFNDSAKQLFEYPSESSLLVDAATAAAAGLPPPPAGPSPPPPTPTGGTSLASYTSKASMSTGDFQLGVTRTTPIARPREPDPAPAAAAAAAEEDNVAWSHTANDHLMF